MWPGCSSVLLGISCLVMSRFPCHVAAIAASLRTGAVRCVPDVLSFCFGPPSVPTRRPHQGLPSRHRLRSTSCPVKSIAAEVGYKSRSHFSRPFKVHTGLNPDSYRSQQGREIQ